MVSSVLVQGVADVGFVRAGTLERLCEDQPGATCSQAYQFLLDEDSADSIGTTSSSASSRSHGLNRTSASRGTFPWDSTTKLYPGWGVGAAQHVAWTVIHEVSKALMAMNPTHPSAVMGGENSCS